MSTTFDIKDCACESATVYLDRAEVKRRVKVSVKQGENEIRFNNLSSFLDEESVRVEGEGPASISEVSFQDLLMTPQEVEEAEGENKEIQEQITQLMEKEKALNATHNRQRKQRDVLNALADNIMKPPVPAKENGEATPTISSAFVTGISEFLDLFENKASELDPALHETETALAKTRQEIRALQGKVNKNRFDQRHKHKRHLSVLLDAKEDTDVTLFISYLVSNASWSPKYDIRVFSDEKKMKIVYHGEIRQGTGEDWNDVKVNLSSALPNVGGTVPQLGTQKLRFQPHVQPPRPMMKSVARARMAPAPEMNMCFDGPPAPMMAEAMSQSAPMAMPQANVREGISSAVYEIVRTANIPSDNTQHKVTVALIDLQPQFLYDAVPIKSTFAFLKAKVTNSSAYALLAGPTSIFLDNNFIAKGSMKAVSPGEEFECSCGIDPAIKISYKPLEKHRANTGWVSKAKITTFKQVTELRNTHQEPVRMRVSEHLPQSTESSIKVHLLEPVVSKEKPDSGPVRITKEHNLEWTFDLAAGVSKELVLKYTIEVPANEELQYLEEFPVEDC